MSVELWSVICESEGRAEGCCAADESVFHKFAAAALHSECVVHSLVALYQKLQAAIRESGSPV